MAWSMFGMALPLLVALVTIPYLIDALGVARFGVLSLAWVVVGYFSLFDMGLGKAMTQLVAKKIGSGEENERNFPFYSKIISERLRMKKVEVKLLSPVFPC